MAWTFLTGFFAFLIDDKTKVSIFLSTKFFVDLFTDPKASLPALFK